MSPLTLVPSLPANSWSELTALARCLQADISELQVDIVDGQFVSAVAWPFTEPDPISELDRLRTLPETIALELDCMVLEPAQYFPKLQTLPVKRIVIHYGSTPDLPGTLHEARASGWVTGLAFTNDIALERIFPLLPMVDYVQVMGIATVGAQGQPFDERTIASVTAIRAHDAMITIAVDGSVNATTIPKLIAAGANRLAPGSAVAKQADPALAYKTLMELMHLD